MKLMSYVTSQGASYGLVEGERVYDLALRLGPSCPDLKSALANDALARIAGRLIAGDADFRVSDIVFLPLIPNPGRIFCVGLNYKAHREETNRADTPDPVLFMRGAQSQTGHERPLLCPIESDAFDFEGEIAAVIGTGGRRIDEARALTHVAGLSCYNDGSVRDWQARSTQWTAGKNFPATGAFGPWLVTPDELPLDRDISLVTRLNGKEVQRTTTDLMTFPLARLVAFISTFTTLEAGDVIVTGTPGGVGFKRTPPLFMKDGDVVEVEVDGIGTLRNPVIKERRAA
ncbi:fumarylacetoacetate hydrolase family protein [Paraburkholderia saeva]|uniref:Ureidoglycolate lyase n=1 Tax=Paraburkholderia saeva TaxID=2777537 RepID=A0A9N8RSV6_9BURK|nr:fumarylacetoacetate hydrolase family protein [Paraburkholderia saeva]CAG4886901.1 Ureidoglycolate lyase [Paraburkholderia saeva]CAG4887088.1 Ureidoglycolate lyase [Paraburkholderia saeva]